MGGPRQVRPAVLHSSARARAATQPASSVLRAPPSQTQGFKTFPDSCPCLRKVTSHTGHGCHLPRGEEAAGEGPGPGEAALRPGLLLLAFWKLEGEGAVDELHTTAGDSRGQPGTAEDSRTGGRGLCEADLGGRGLEQARSGDASSSAASLTGVLCPPGSPHTGESLSAAGCRRRAWRPLGQHPSAHSPQLIGAPGAHGPLSPEPVS